MVGDESVSMAKDEIVGGTEKLDASNTKRWIGVCRVIIGTPTLVVGGGGGGRRGGVEGGGEEEGNAMTRVKLHDLGGRDG